MAATTKVINVDVKAIAPIYPDAENVKPVIESIKQIVKSQYESLRLADKAVLEYDLMQRKLRGFPLREDNPDFVEPDEYPEYDDAITFAAAFSTGTSDNEVVTVSITITLTIADGFAFAVKLLDKIDISGTFAINPTNRVTAY